MEQTIRFRAESRYAYARALAGLVRRAREPGPDFSFGPLDMAAAEDQGLAVSGPDVASWADDFLAGVPGLHRVDE